MPEIGAQSIVLVEDNESVADLMRGLLSEAGHRPVVVASVGDILHDGPHDSPQRAPDCIMLDLTASGGDGSVMADLLGDERFSHTSLIVVSDEGDDALRRQAFDAGARGFVGKPINPRTFVGRVERILGDHMDLNFWGVRGTMPVPGDGSLRYGGNTSCVSIEFPHDQLFVFDAGSGIKRLSNHLMSQQRKRINGKIFISHPHWDHINFLPFFVPLYIMGNEFEILGARHGDLSMEQVTSAQMDGVYFPITLKEFAAQVHFRDLREETIEIDNISVSTKLLSHPGVCLGYRVDYKDRSVCYITDNELFLETNDFYNPYYEQKLADFVRGTNVLITDTTYTDDEYQGKVGWGHSCVSKVAQLAHAAEVENLYLFHHDPDQSDDRIDEKLEMVQAVLADEGSAVNCVAPKEGDMYRI